MAKKKKNQYYFSVEGETEKWYLEHLEVLINSIDGISYTVEFNIRKCKSVTKMSKSITAIYPTKVFHICDYESNGQFHIEQFETMLKELKNVKKINKNLNYKLGYSNFAFDLWVILHKKQQLGSVADRSCYINGINKAYKEKFQCMDDYKEEDNFKRVLSQITIDDVIRAVRNRE